MSDLYLFRDVIKRHFPEASEEKVNEVCSELDDIAWDWEREVALDRLAGEDQ